MLLGYCLIVGLAAWFLMAVFVEEVKPGVRSTQEDALVDTANLLAVMVADDVKAGPLDGSATLRRFQAYARRGVDARISGVPKTSLDYRVYITDRQGIVLFDTQGEAVGQDYSRWNDVYLTLQGKYGARSSRDPNVYDEEGATIMYVAAPIRDERQRIIGVLTVAKPNASVQPFIERSQRKMLRRGAILLGASLLIGLGFAFWLARALRQLMSYVTEVEAGKKPALPQLGRHEIGTLGRALEAMRTRLEGKEYVEELMHTLAHELKSPIAAIQGSAELLSEDMPQAERRRFLENILEQNARQKQLIDRLLALVRVEKQQQLDVAEAIDGAGLVAQVAADFSARLAARQLRLQAQVEPLTLRGDTLLLRQALGNVLDNAIDFAPAGGVIEIAAAHGEQGAVISVRDHGDGIPSFALGRLFERFYSLPRADGRKSTGLGLPFVREVMVLHQGSVSVANHAGGGVLVRLTLPLH